MIPTKASDVSCGLFKICDYVLLLSSIELIKSTGTVSTSSPGRFGVSLFPVKKMTTALQPLEGLFFTSKMHLKYCLHLKKVEN